jgi:succinate-semialdehyde dehydrogenase/glutarate-semialdehyde dehydrogenase
MGIASINPATGEKFGAFESHTGVQIEEKLQRAAAAFREYRCTSFARRQEWMLKVAEILDSEKRHFARLMTLEMGKPIGAAVAEAEKCARNCRFYVENAERLLADEVVGTEAERSIVRYQPLGPILAVMPWNFPFWQVFRFATPALMAGNVGLLKHASNVPQCALLIEEIFRRAGFPEGVFQTLLIASDRVGQLLDDDRIKAATLTGSEDAGSDVASRAAKRIKKTVLELGGSDPYLVMPSADLDQAVQTAVQARILNNGQSCIAAKRFILQTSPVYPEWFPGARGATRGGSVQ